MPAHKTNNKNSQKAKKEVRRILWAAPVCLQDLSSGAAMQIRLLFEGFAQRNIECHVFGAFTFDALSGTAGIPNFNDLLENQKHTFFAFTHNSVHYQYMRTASRFLPQLTYYEIGIYYTKLIQYLEKFSPDIVMLYGYSPLEMSLISACKQRGIKVCLSIFNGSYLNTYFQDIDLILTDSYALARHYLEKSQVQIMVNGVCLDLNSVLIPKTQIKEQVEKKYITFVNPVPVKGMSIFIKLLLMAKQRRPEWQFLLLESRGTWREAVKNHKLNPKDFTHLSVVANTPHISQVFALTEVLIVPSLWFESFGRVALEAVLNSIPVLASTSGGLPDTVDLGGICLDVPQKCSEDYNYIPSDEEMEEWFNALETLMDKNKKEYWQEECRKTAEKYSLNNNIDKALHYLTLALNNDKSLSPY